MKQDYFMIEISRKKIIELLKKKSFDPKISWFYIQFDKKFEQEYNIYEISFIDVYKNLIRFLREEKIVEVLFFPEPEFNAKEWEQKKIPNAFVKIGELYDFLSEHVNTLVNCHVADKDLKWIFTITHEEDYFISGTKKFTQRFIKFFEGADIMSRAEIKKKWNN